MNSDPKIVDGYFLKQIWNKHDKEQAQTLTMNLLDAYVEVLAGQIGLSFRDTYHLAREMGYHSITAYIDTVFRLKYHRNDLDYAKGSDLNFQKNFQEFFSETTVLTPLGVSRVLLARLSNIMHYSLGYVPIFRNIEEDSEQISLEYLDLPLESQEKYWRLHYKLTYRLPNAVTEYTKAFRNRLRQITKNNLVRIGHIRLNRKYMWQLPDIQWVPLKMELEDYLMPVSVEKRQEIFNLMREAFLAKIKNLHGWETLTGLSSLPKNFLELLLAFIVLKSKPLIFQHKRLHQAIDRSEKSLKSMKLNALYSEGEWFRFNNVIIAVAARRLKLPIMEFQTGGRGIYRTEDMPSTEADFDLAWANLSELNKGLRTKRKLIANPEFKSTQLFRKRRSGKAPRIMYTPVSLSNIFSMENTHSISAMDMEGHRKWAADIFLQCEDVLEKMGSSLYIKIKGFGYTLLSNHENMLFPRIKLETVPVRYLKNGSAGQYLDQMDLHIFCGPSTTFAESLNKNIPSISLWDPNCFEYKPIYKKLFLDLETAGIIVTDTASCRSTLQKRLGTDEWWSSATQTARKKFCDKFAFSADDWVSINNKVIVNLANNR